MPGPKFPVTFSSSRRLIPAAALGLLAGLTLLGPLNAKGARAAEYWPVICRGPVANMTVTPGRLTITARAGMRAGRPRRGECVWLDRGMNRRGEARRGGRVIFRLSTDIRTVSVNSGGRVSHRITGNRDAVRLWQANAAGRLFRFGARRTGRGVYDARLKPTSPWPSPGWPGNPTPAPIAFQNVRVIIDSIYVIRDGDEISPGDWFVKLVAGPAPRPEASRTARWPRYGTVDVRDGQTYRPRTLRTVVRGLRAGEALRVGIIATDCDSDTLLELGGRLPGELGDIFRSLGGDPRSDRCSGEEFGEMSGAPDVAGTVMIFRPSAWRTGMHRFVRRVRGDELEYVIRGRIIPVSP